LIVGEAASLMLEKKFSRNLLKFMRYVLEIDKSNCNFDLLKKNLCDEFKLIAYLHPQVDGYVVSFCIEDINTNNSKLLLELVEQSDRVTFLNDLETIRDKYSHDLSIISYQNYLFIPRETGMEMNIPMDVDRNITFINVELNTNSEIAFLEDEYIQRMRTAQYFRLLGDRDSLLKSIAIYSGTIPHLESFGNISTNSSSFDAVARYSMLEAAHAYTQTIPIINVEELVIYNRKLLQQSLQLVNYPATMNQMIATQRDISRRHLAAALTRFASSKQFSYRKMLRTLLEVIVLYDEIKEKIIFDTINKRNACAAYALINLQYGLVLADKLEDYKEAERHFEIAMQHNAKAYSEDTSVISSQSTFALKAANLVFSLLGYSSSEKQLSYLQACEDEFSHIPNNQLDEALSSTLAIVRRSLVVGLNAKGLKFNSNSPKEVLEKAKNIFLSMIIKIDAIKPPYKIPMDNEYQQFSYLYYSIVCLTDLIKTYNFDNNECTDELFLAIQSCILSHAVCEKPSVLYYNTLRNFIALLAELADKIGHDECYYVSVKVCVQSLLINKYLRDANLPDAGLHLERLHSQLLKSTYHFIFAIEDTYERALPENMETILEAVEQFKNINSALLRDMDKFYYTSIQMELKKLKIACEDLMSIRLVSLQNDYRLDLCFFKNASDNDKALFIKDNDVMSRAKHKNVTQTLKDTMSTWVKIKAGLNTVLENELVDDINNALRIDKLLKTSEPRERPLNKLSEAREQKDRPWRRYSF
jgi:hypothetical protein